jgi:ferredoxin
VGPKKQNKAMIWAPASAISAGGLIVMIFYLVTTKLGFFESLGAIVFGGAIWAAIVFALMEIRARLRLSPVPDWLRKPRDGPITLLCVLLMALGFYALWEIPAAQQLGITGALVTIAVSAVLVARELTKPVYEITITNDGGKLYLVAGSKLMQSLKANGYELFAQCGGKGTCATCRCKIPEGLPQEKRLPTMYGPLNEKLRSEGWILSCQIPVNAHMTVELFKPLVLKWPASSPLTQATTAPARAAASGLAPAAQKIRAVLPGFDCNWCGFPTCEKFAEALAAGKAKLDGCHPGGQPVLEKVRKAVAEAGVKVS